MIFIHSPIMETMAASWTLFGIYTCTFITLLFSQETQQSLVNIEIDRCSTAAKLSIQTLY